MINFKDITTALETQLKDALTTQAYTITRNKRQNEEDNIAVDGWVGIYRGGVNYQPHSSGPTPWLAEIKIRVEIQAASFKSEADCEERLEDVQEFVLDAVNTDKTIDGTVAMITEYDLDYDDNYSEQMQTSYQFLTLIIKAEVRA